VPIQTFVGRFQVVLDGVKLTAGRGTFTPEHDRVHGTHGASRAARCQARTLQRLVCRLYRLWPLT
jgi:hypothetical protein